MADDYSAGAGRARDPAFLDRVTVALIVAAGTVAIEDRSQYPDSTMFNLRRTLAVNVLQDPVVWGQRFAWIVQYDQRCRQDDPTQQITDDLLSGIIYWTWNAVAGAGPALTPPPSAPPAAAVVEGGRIVGAPAGSPLDLFTADDEQVQPRHPVTPPGAERGWPYASPWQEDRD